jgi:hypothetical protein
MILARRLGYAYLFSVKAVRIAAKIVRIQKLGILMVEKNLLKKP